MKINSLPFIFCLAITILLFVALYPTTTNTVVTAKKLPDYCKYAKFSSCKSKIPERKKSCKCLRKGPCGNCVQDDCGCNLTIYKAVQSDIKGMDKTIKGLKSMLKFARYTHIKLLKNKRLSDNSRVKFKKPKCWRSLTRTYCPKM
ncbi:hypothetical protein ABK040_011718 [Willaertia magna]